MTEPIKPWKALALAFGAGLLAPVAILAGVAAMIGIILAVAHIIH